MKRKLARRLKVLAFPALAFLAAACVAPATVFLSPNYGSAQIKRVALITFTDYPSMAGSGQLVSGVFSGLLLKDYAVEDSSEVTVAMQQLALQPGAAPDADELHTLAAKLGVDAFVVGQVTDFTDSSDQTVVEDVPIEQDTPIYSPVEAAGAAVGHSRGNGGHARGNGGHARGNGGAQIQMTVTGTDFNTVEQPEEVTESVPAHVGLSVHMVDARTGDVLWSASDSEYGDYLNDASQVASAEILKTLQARLKKSQS